ncbi:pol polyprotein [Tanacetum coccineum]|uniref:Pol polyprotein n=1 Tax=Tanacetum coccineum TaxID=301880 RepID=A0ABQ5BAM1_9ASTR
MSEESKRSPVSVKPPSPSSADRKSTSASSLSTSSSKKVVIKSADMKQDMQHEAVDIAITAFEKCSVEKDVAEQIKKEFDVKYGPTWHCIVGKNFGNKVAHELARIALTDNVDDLYDGCVPRSVEAFVQHDVQDLQVLLHDIHAEGMTLSETFQVAAIIEKLPPSWVEFKNYLKHKQKEMSVEDLVVRLRIEEDNKLAQKDTYTPDSAKANMVEHAGSSSSRVPGELATTVIQHCHRAANCKMPKRVLTTVVGGIGLWGKLDMWVLIRESEGIVILKDDIRERAQVD